MLVELLERLVLPNIRGCGQLNSFLPKKTLLEREVRIYLNLTLISMAHLSKSSSLWTLTSPAQLICSKL